jgi:hypothetical protein
MGFSNSTKGVSPVLAFPPQTEYFFVYVLNDSARSVHRSDQIGSFAYPARQASFFGFSPSIFGFNPVAKGALCILCFGLVD